MTDEATFTTSRSLMTILARAMNLVSPDIERHHEQTAYVALFVAREMGMPELDVVTALYAALLHDVGSIVVEVPPSVAELESHAREVAAAGASLLADLPGFGDAAQAIGYSQCSWSDAMSRAIEEGTICERLGRIASVVHLADTVSLLVDQRESVLNQSKRVLDVVRSCSGTQFCPEAVDAFERVAGAEFFWMDLALNPLFLTYFTGDIAQLTLSQTIELTSFVSRIIDFRSPFTAMHSAGVAASARELALLAGFGEKRAMEMEIAGNLHDVGKLAVPRAILEKPGRLTDEEFNIIKEHPYYTSLVLLEVEGFDEIRLWAALHHEKLDGSGYPFHFGASNLDECSRIMAVADIFSAITEERPYRAGMTREQAAAVLRDNVRGSAICGDLVGLLLDNYEYVDAARDQASHVAGKRYFNSLDDRAHRR